MSELRRLIEIICTSGGVKRKKNIRAPLKAFNWEAEKMLDPIGDDAAVLVTNHGYLLFSCDGIIPGLVRDEPRWAGYCAVLVSVSDIVAMGGRPTAVVNLLSAPDDETAALIAEGMAEACGKLGVPMVGGHYLPEEAEGVATAILGTATHLLRGFSGRAGHSLVIAIDLDGKPFKQYLQWDCTSDRSPDEIRRKLEILPRLAEDRLAVAARDISNAGILGTVAMLAENAGCGALIHLDRIPKPDTVKWEVWLRMFPGYGFIIAAEPECTNEIIARFAKEGIASSVIGQLMSDTRIVVEKEAEQVVLIDWAVESMVVGQHVQ